MTDREALLKIASFFVGLEFDTLEDYEVKLVEVLKAHGLIRLMPPYDLVQLTVGAKNEIDGRA